jgi:hypothetical protein
MPVDNDSSSDGVADTGSETITYDREPDELPARSVVRAVAATIGVDPRRMRPLSDVVDPDALNQLFEPASEDRPTDRVTFRFNGCTVTVYEDDRTVVSPPKTG